jgi:transposase
MLTKILPEVPPETARLAHAIFNERNLYLQVGDALCSITADFGAKACCKERALADQASHLLALITVFQFIEMLTDRQANEALRQRLDWKYALHLPAAFPAPAYLQTCQFRRSLLTNPDEMAALHGLLGRLQHHGLTVKSPAEQNADPVCAEHVVRTVCAINRLDQLAGAFMAALEYLAGYQSAWLRQHTQPGWYLRYRRDSAIRFLPPAPAEWPARFEIIGNDGRQLLDAIYATPALSAGPTALADAPLMRALQRELQRQFEEQDDRLRMRAPSCSECEFNTTGL